MNCIIWKTTVHQSVMTIRQWWVCVSTLFCWSFSVWDSPGGSDGKESACNAGDPGFDLCVGKIPWRQEWQPTPVFLPRKFQGQRNLAAAIHRVAKSQTWLSTHTPHPTLQLLLLAPRLSHRKPQFYSSHAILSSFLQGKAWRQLCQSLLQHFQGLSTDPSTHNHSFHSTSGPSQLAPGPAPPHLQRSLLQVPYSLAKMTKS